MKSELRAKQKSARTALTWIECLKVITRGTLSVRRPPSGIY